MKETAGAFDAATVSHHEAVVQVEIRFTLEISP
jgi:hypothetical protein